MFFDILLLHPRHKTHLSMPWIAATRGVGKLAKKKVAEVDIVKLCEVLLEFIMNGSSSFKKRFSLRFSAILINGTVKIYKEQVKSLEDEVVNIFYSYSKTQLRIRDLENFDSPPTPAHRVKTKRAKKTVIVETPESLIGALEQPIERVQARNDEITIREELPARPLELFGEEDDLGRLLNEDALRLGLIDGPAESTTQPRYPAEPSSSKSESDPQAPRTILVEAVIHAEPTIPAVPTREPVEPTIPAVPTTEHVEPSIPDVPAVEQLIPPIEFDQEIPRLELEQVIPPVGITVEEQPMEIEPIIQQVAPLAIEQISEIQIQEAVQEIEQQVVPVPAQKEVDVIAPARRGQSILGELQADVVAQRDQQIVTKRAKKGKVHSDMVIKVKPNKSSVHINRCLRGMGMYVEVEDDRRVPILELNSKFLRNKFSTRDDVQLRTADVNIRAAVSERTSVQEGSIGQIRPPVTAETPEMEVPLGSSTGAIQTPSITLAEQPLVGSTPAATLGVTRRRDETIEETAAIAASHETPRKRRKTTKEVEIPKVSTEPPSTVQDMEGIQVLPEIPRTEPIQEQQQQMEIPAQPEELVQERQPEIMQVGEPPQQPIEEIIQVVEQVPEEHPEIMQVQERAPSRLEKEEERIRLEKRSALTFLTREQEKEIEKKRHQKIVDFVATWNSDQGDLTIDAVCEHVFKRMNRLGIARTFADLLILAKLGYVLLHSHEGSFELKSITKGRRFD